MAQYGMHLTMVFKQLFTGVDTHARVDQYMSDRGRCSLPESKILYLMTQDGKIRR
jgi:hypothetical protein